MRKDLAFAAYFLLVTAGGNTCAWGQSKDERISPPSPVQNRTEVPTPTPTSTYDLHREWSVSEINDAVGDCLAAARDDGMIDDRALANRGWARNRSIQFQGPASQLQADLYFRDQRAIGIEHLGRAQACHVMFGIASEEAYDQVVAQFPLAVGSELFAEHEGHTHFKNSMLEQLGPDFEPAFQFTNTTVLAFQVMETTGRLMMSVKIIPMP